MLAEPTDGINNPRPLSPGEIDGTDRRYEDHTADVLSHPVSFLGHGVPLVPEGYVDPVNH